MSSSWDVSAPVAQLLGPDGLAQLADVDPAGALTCQVCGQVKPAGDPGPMAVLAVPGPGGAVVAGFAHPACRDRAGDHWPGLLERLGGPEGMDSRAFFGVRAGPRLRAVLAFEPGATAREVLPNGEGRDAWVAGHLAAGFVTARAPLEDLVAPLAPAWSLTGRGGALTLAHPSLGVGYTQELTEPVRAWLRVARREGRALVLTGAGLGLSGVAGELPDFEWARTRGLLVAAAVPVR